MKKGIFLLFLVSVLFFYSCVSTKVFNDLEVRYSEMKINKNTIEKSQDSLKQAFDALDEKWHETMTYLKRSRDSVNISLTQINSLQKEYFLLAQNSDQKIDKSIAINNSLLKEIAIKESQLLARSERVNQLEDLMSQQKEALKLLKQRLSDALLNFEGKGLTVEQRNGKVYVSMENKLLFKSGRWDVGIEGQKALGQLGVVLADNPNIIVLIEGHTDNVPFSSKGALASNWDLSTKRATSMVNILLENELILPQNITAAGRGEFVPIAPNNTSTGRAANRRIEVILSPQWDEINALLNN
ncbi:MAG: chemotaxis protein MotB [Flavobacteriaceae bacterium]|jgi:chemotaxis protein MotB|tara:strand:+ start:260 stop:1156 length:897 start_codon:yes stop_codon:yes gene_type:complete